MKILSKRILCPLSVIIAVTVSITWGFTQTDVIILEKTGHRKSQIVFRHKAHVDEYGAKCLDCHHKGDNDKCSTCHLKRDNGNIPKLKGAFHQQCRNCHRKSNGPRACGRCHRKSQK